MKVGIVCYPSLGGSGVVATELGHALAQEGHQVHFITYEEPFRLRLDDPNIFFHQVDIYRYDLFKYPSYALPLAVKMATVSKEFNLDVLHVHYAIPHATSAFLAKQILKSSKPAIVTTLHGTDITLVGRDPAYFEIVKFSIEHSDGITAVSNDLREQTIQHFQIEKPIEVIYNFCLPRTECVGCKPLRKNFIGEDEKLLIHVSNFRSVKNPEDVIRIFVEVRKQLKCKLLLLGSGEGIDSIRSMVRDLNLSREVFFLGVNRDIAPYVASSDLLLLPSSQESFGLVALEAMMYGVPVIATRVGGLPEVIDDGKSGFLSSPGDVAEMAKNAVKLLSDPLLYRKFSAHAIKRAEEKFCVAKILPQYVDFYKKSQQYS